MVAVPRLQRRRSGAMTATLDRLRGRELLINVVTGGDPAENKGDGIFLSHDERYAVTREFLRSTASYSPPHGEYRASTSPSRTARLLFRPRRRRARRSISAVRPRPVSMLPPRPSTSTSPGRAPAQVAEKLEPVAALAQQKGSGHLRHPLCMSSCARQRRGWKPRDDPDPPSSTTNDCVSAEDLRRIDLCRPHDGAASPASAHRLESVPMWSRAR